MIAQLAIISLAAAVQTANPSSAADSDAPQILSAALSAQPAASVPHANSDSVESLQSVRRRLRNADIKAVDSAPDPNVAEDMMRHIALLQSLQLPRPATPAADRPPQRPETDSAAHTSPQTSTHSPSSKTDLLDAYTLNLPQSAPDPTHAFAAAEALYKLQDYQRAAALYLIELNRSASQKEADPKRDAWTIYQIANCLRIQDPAQAVVYYDSLMTRFPNSPWTPAAGVQRKLIMWQSANRPDLLLEKYAPDPNSL